jgi:hypothetical protein
VDLGLGRQDAAVDGLFIGRVTSRLPGTLTLSLADGSGHETLRRIIALPAGDTTVLERFETPAAARATSLTFETPSENRIIITDLRIEGQSPALREYLRRTLVFPAS